MENVNINGNFRHKDSEFVVRLSLFEFLEDDVFFVYSPSLDLSGYGNSKKEARESFEITLEEFFRYTTNKKTLISELQNLGWNVDKKKKKYEQPPLDQLISSREHLSEILRDKEFNKVNSDFNVPVLA